jgi:hypothetical protein
MRVVLLDSSSSASTGSPHPHTPIIMRAVVVIVAMVPKASRRLRGKDQPFVFCGATVRDVRSKSCRTRITAGCSGMVSSVVSNRTEYHPEKKGVVHHVISGDVSKISLTSTTTDLSYAGHFGYAY